MEVTLIWHEVLKNENGFPKKIENAVEIYANEKSITRQEFYQSMRAGITVKLVLEVRQEDFELSAHDEDGRNAYARELIYDGQKYDIIRIYKTGKSKMELICR